MHTCCIVNWLPENTEFTDIQYKISKNIAQLNFLTLKIKPNGSTWQKIDQKLRKESDSG